MLFILLVAAAMAFREPKSSDSLTLQRRQWVRSDQHERTPCVAVDAYVRHGHDLWLLLIGTCTGLAAQKTTCTILPDVEGEFSDGDYESDRADVRKARGVIKAPVADGRGAQKSNVYAGRNGPGAELYNQWLVDCGKVEQPGRVTLAFGTAKITDIRFRPVSHRPEPGVAVCSRLYDTMGWPALHTVLLLEWLEWQLAIGVDRVHLYVHSLDVPKLWPALTAFGDRVAMHVWSDESEDDDDIVKHAWELAQLSHLADCFLRLESQVRYIAPLDHDEFLQPIRGTLGAVLDRHFASNPQTSSVVMIEPSTVIPETCNDGGEALYVADFCKAHANAYGKTKYVVRSSVEHPVQLFSTVHKAHDDRPVATIKPTLLRLLHIGRFAQFNARASKAVDSAWNKTLSAQTYESLRARGPVVLAPYSAARERLE